MSILSYIKTENNGMIRVLTKDRKQCKAISVLKISDKGTQF
jgi:hypothetical protein